jgi:hypothetical protein
MTNLLIKKLHAQAVERVDAELQKEAETRVKKYLGRTIGLMVREKVISRDEAIKEAKLYGLTSSDIAFYDYTVETAGCITAQPSYQPGNRC